MRAAWGLEGLDLVVAVPDVAVEVNVEGVDRAATDIVGCSYMKAGSTDESGKTK